MISLKGMLLVLAIVLLFLAIPGYMVFGLDVAVSDTWATGTGPVTATAGTNRLVIFVDMWEGTGAGGDKSVTAVDLGGNSMTKAVNDTIHGWNGCSIWYLIDANIPGGSNSFTVTHTGGAPAHDLHSYVVLRNVDQTTPINNTCTDHATNKRDSCTVTTVAGGFSIFVDAYSATNAITWTGPTVATDQSTSSSRGSTADQAHAGSGSLEGLGVHSGTDRRHVIIGAEIASDGVSGGDDLPRRRRKILNGSLSMGPLTESHIRTFIE